jgi:hypothetical protein
MSNKSIEELRATKNQQPFVPFEILVSEGQRYPIHHPDAVAWDDPPTMLWLVPRHMPSVKLRLAEVTGITELPQQPPASKPKPKRKSK